MRCFAFDELQDIETLRCFNPSMLLRDTKPGAGSTRITARGPSSGCKSATRQVSFTSVIRQVRVLEIVHSLNTRI